MTHRNLFEVTQDFQISDCYIAYLFLREIFPVIDGGWLVHWLVAWTLWHTNPSKLFNPNPVYTCIH